MVMALVACASCSGRMYDQDRPDQTREPPAFLGTMLRRAEGAVPRALPPDEGAPPVTRALFVQGRESFHVHCAPCHDTAGTGGGIVVQRGFPRPVSLHDLTQRALTDRAIFAAISTGKGRMAGFADVMPPHERWAVVAWIRALQWSQDARTADLPEAALQQLVQATREEGR
jgi:mono/diheme cytochrome c family protein